MTENNQTKKNTSGKGKKRYSANKNRRPKALSPTKITQKYDNLMEQYLIARKKYFEFYARLQGKQLDKIKNNYETALTNLRNFGEKLNDWQKDVLDQKVDAFPEDRQYTQSHEIEPVGDSVSFVGEFEDPHLLPTQKAENWASDTEESTGTIEDYAAYKASN